MAFCSNCGQELKPGAKFCANCGTAVKTVSNHEPAVKSTTQGETKKNTEKKASAPKEPARKVRKCPACGAELESFTAICPICGHEIETSTVASSIKDFTSKIHRLDEAIADSPVAPKGGWSSWGGLRKVGWVLLNLFTFCIPLLIYLLLPILGIGKLAALTSEEKKKVQFINNYTFPNDRETILEGLIFIEGQVESLAGGKKNRNTYRWIAIWKNKADQLYEKAEILFKDDEIAQNAYNDILVSEKKVKTNLIIKLIIAAVIVLLALFLFVHVGNNGDGGTPYSSKSESPTITEDIETNESEGIYTYQVKDYSGKNLASIGEVYNDRLFDEYGAGKVHVAIVTKDGMIVPETDSESKKNYVVVDQNIAPGTNITVVLDRDSSGEPYSNLVDYQSYDEIILYVSPVGDSSYEPEHITVDPTLDRHLYHIRDYVGRNAATIGEFNNEKRTDEYGEASIKLVFTTKDGSYVDVENLNDLKKYIVVDQDVAPNSELKIQYDKDSEGYEYDNLIENLNIEEINLSVESIDNSIVKKMPKLKKSNDD